MKKTLLSFIIITIVIFSCKKEHKNGVTPAQTTYKVNFNVSGFTQSISAVKGKLQINSLKTDSIAVSSYLDQLYYCVFDSNNNLVHSIAQDSTNSSFGTISDYLPAGTYTVVIAAGKPGLLLPALTTGSSKNINQFAIYYQFPIAANNYNYDFWKDTFFNEFQFTVSGNINTDVSLNRNVGELQIKILDTIPANASSISVSINQDYLYYFFLSSRQFDYPEVSTTTTILPQSAKQTVNYTTSNIIGNTSVPFIATVTCYDANKQILGTAVINNVSCQKNKKTILSGRLFGSNNGFSVGLSAWDPVVITTPFSQNGTGKQTN